MDARRAVDIAADVRSGRLKARAVANEALRRIEAGNAALNAFTLVTAARAEAEADRIDAAVAQGRDPGPLAGVPFAVKNLFDLAGEVTVAGSRISRDDPPAAQDAAVVSRLCAAGAICVGATNMGEYAYDFTTENAHYGPTHNPHDLSRSAGGSSGGSGAAVGGGLVPIAIGTDTNGSIRVPASFCGVWGLKPTFGRLPRAGAYLFVESLDHVGPLAASVADLAAAYDAMKGGGNRDPVQGEPIRVAVLGGYFEKNLSAQGIEAVRRVADALEAHLRIDLPRPEIARAAAYAITAAEGGHRHLAHLRTRAADFDPATRDRFIAGALGPAAWLIQAQKFRAVWRREIEALFAHADVWIAPATPVPATHLGQNLMSLDGNEMLVRPNLGLFTQPISLLGLPVIAAPVPNPGGLPIGVQLIAAPGGEARLLRVAARLEQAGVCSATVTGQA